MPPIMSARHFQKQTRMTFERRPKTLQEVDLALEWYHDAVRHPSPDKEGRQANALETIIEQIALWSRGLQRVGPAEHAPYAHVRDRHGQIAWLEYAAKQELPAANRRLRAAANGGGNVNPAQLNTPVRHQHGGHGQAQPNAPLPNSFLSSQAYDAAAHFLSCGWNTPVQKQDIIDAACQANPAAASPMRVTFPALVQGIMQMGYLRLYGGQHCTQEVVMNTLLGATPLKPIMVVVGGNEPPFSAIVVTGHRDVTRGGITSTEFTATNGIRPSEDTIFSISGNYAHQEQDGRVVAAQLMPQLGYLKIMA